MEKGGLCAKCAGNLRLSKTPPDIIVEGGGDGDGVKAYGKFLESVNRGGLSTPSDLCYIACLYVFNIFNEIMEREETKVQFLETQEPRKVFCELIILRLDLDFANELLDIECNAGHSFTKGPMLKIGEKMFNIMMKNKVSETNQAIVDARKRTWGPKTDASARKAAKLQSQNCF